MNSAEADPMSQRSTPEAPRRLIVGISGATGFVFGLRVLELARCAGF